MLKPRSPPSPGPKPLTEISGMICKYVRPESGGVEMYIDLRRSYRLMPEHLLYGTQIGPTLEEMGGEAVTECVGRYGAFHAGLYGEVAYDIKYHDAGEMTATAVQEHEGFFAGLGIGSLAVACAQIGLGVVCCCCRHGYHPLFRSFAGYQYKTFVEV